MPESTLNNSERERYSRQMVLPGFGEAAQQKLKYARVLVIGAGGLGIPALQYLAAAGVGTLGIVDFDTVERSNLHRQVIYREEDIGKPKADVTAAHLKARNREIEIISYPLRLTKENAHGLFKEYDIIVDGTDNIPTRYLVNDMCVLCEKPEVYGAIYRYEGQVSVFNCKTESGGYSPNYRDLFPDSAGSHTIPNCAEAGVIGVLPGIVGTYQAMEVIKLITGIGEPLSGKLLLINTLNAVTRILKFKRNESRSKDGIIAENTSIPACNSATGKAAITEINEIGWPACKRWLEEGKDVQIIDIRSLDQPAEPGLNGERIPLDILLQQPESINRQRPVVLYCNIGVRSAWAVQNLQERFGFGNLFSLRGGVEAVRIAEKLS